MTVLDTNFGRRSDCEVISAGYDQYVDGELVERVDRLYYAGDCDDERREGLDAQPVGMGIGIEML